MCYANSQLVSVFFQVWIDVWKVQFQCSEMQFSGEVQQTKLNLHFFQNRLARIENTIQLRGVLIDPVAVCMLLDYARLL
jgi:hypothetical protein